MENLFVLRKFTRNIGLGLALIVSTGGLAGGGQLTLSQDRDTPEKKRTGAQATPEASKAGSNPFTSGRWTLVGYGSAAVGKTARKIYAGHVGLGYYFVDNLSVNLEAVGYFIDQKNETSAGSLDLLPRWHYLRSRNLSLYLDASAGLIYSDKRLGESGTHFNFTLQGGLGATYDLTEGFIPMTGVRWLHISNARLQGKDRNVGFDSPMFYLGVMTPF